MADIFDDPEVQPQSIANPAAPGIMDEWHAALQNPKARTALLQFGINMMQPPGFGQTPAGHIGQSIGAAGEALDRQDTQALKEREETRKESDTASLGKYRTDQSETKAILADAATSRAQSAQVQAEALAQSRIAQSHMYEARARNWDSQVQLLEIKAAQEPQNLELKKQLNEAKIAKARADSEYASARAANVGTSNDLANQRIQATRERTDVMRTQGEVNAGIRADSLYTQQKAAYDKANQFNPKAVPFEQTKDGMAAQAAARNRQGGGTVPRTGGTPQVNEAQARTDAQSAIAAGRDPELVRQRFKELYGKDL